MTTFNANKSILKCYDGYNFNVENPSDELQVSRNLGVEKFEKETIIGKNEKNHYMKNAFKKKKIIIVSLLFFISNPKSNC